MASLCDETLSSCPSHDVTRDLSGDGHNLVSHSKHRTFTMTVGSTVIPLQSRTRTFSIGYSETWSWTELKIVVDSNGDAEDCGTKTGTSSASISEDVTFTDSEIYFIDHINKIVLWREWEESCVFSQDATKVATFKVAYGSFYSHWFELDITINQSEKWYILVNGVKEEVDSWIGSVTLPRLNVLWPLPPGLATPNVAPDEFYDYNSDEALAELDGGKDFYYPSWLRGMGINRGIDESEAADRYFNYFLHAPALATEKMSLPSMGYADYNGNAVKDVEGNTLVSFKTRNKYINRIYSTDNTILDLNDSNIIEGAHLTLYPVGLI